jgi:hypothetical protein
MTTAGYVFMAVAWIAIGSLTGYCYKKILSD